MRARSCARALTIVLAGLLLPGTAQAAEPKGRHHHRDAPTTDPQGTDQANPGESAGRAAAQQATELTEQAYQLQRRGSYNDAIKLYEEALRIDPAPKRHYNLAIPLEQAGRLAEALREYRAFQRDELGEQPEHRSEADARASRLVQRMGRVDLLPVHDDEAMVTTLVAEASGERPRCLLDTQVGGKKSYLCQRGPVQAQLLIGGVVVASRWVTVGPGTASPVAFAPRSPVRISANRPSPSLVLDQSPLRLDRRLPVVLPLLLGPHVLSAREGRETIMRRFTVLDGQHNDVDLRFSPSRRWIYWVAAGGVVVITAAILGGVLSRPAPPGGADIHLNPPI